MFLKGPARGLAAAPRDDGATLNRLLMSFQTSQEAERDEIQPLEVVCSESPSLDLANEQMADELDDGEWKIWIILHLQHSMMGWYATHIIHIHIWVID